MIVTADDFGLCAGVNQGISEAFAAGCLRSASLLVNQPGFDHAVRIAAGYGAEFGVGLHFNLTLGQPLTSAKSLVDSRTGEFLPVGRLIRRAIAGRIDAHDVVRECDAQIRRARDAGVRLTHLDGHHHVHVIPGIAAAVADSANRAAIMRLRRPDELTLDAWRPWRRLAMRTVLAHWSRRAPFFQPSARFAGLTLYDSSDFARGLRAVIGSLKPGITELAIHPGYASGLPSTEPYQAQRERELRALRGVVRDIELASMGIALQHFGEV